jgi:hypothetical protein
VSASPSPSAKPTGTAEEQILAQYRRFWTDAFPRAFAAPADQRRTILSPVVTETLLSELLRVAREIDEKGQISKGVPVLLEQAVTRERANAVVLGCLDMSAVVEIDEATGKVVHRGPPTDSTTTFMKRERDEVWRAYALGEPTGSPC